MSSAIDGFMKTREKYQSDSKISNILNGNQKREQRENIKDFYGRVIGTIITKPNGDKVIKDFYGRVKGTYIKKSNYTKDFYGRVAFRRSPALVFLMSPKTANRQPIKRY